MHELLSRKMVSLRSHLLSAYNDSSAYPAPVTGREREVFLHALLERILPPHFRVGSGVITDHRGTTTGQIDLVVELPLSLSFPVVGENRMYFADTVGAAFEVKSDLSTQWEEAYKKKKEVDSLRKQKVKNPGQLLMMQDYQVPFFIVSYTGPKNIETIENKINPSSEHPPAGIYVVESNLFVGNIDDTWVYGKTEATALLAFISCLYTALSKQQHRPLDLRSYV